MANKLVGLATVACLVTAALPLSTLLSPLRAQSVAADVPLASASRRAVTVRLDMDRAPLVEVLRRIAQQADLYPAYGAAVTNSRVRVTAHLKDVSVEDAFEYALRGTGLMALISGSGVSFVKSSGGSAAMTQGTILGKAVDAKTRQGLRGATVMLVGTNTRTTSGDDGSFRLSGVVPGSYTVSVRMLGYVKTTKTVTIVDGQTASLDVSLEPSVSALDQVIVTGTVVATAQREVPNAMTVITAKDLEQRGITHIDQLFRGDVPGMFAVNQGSGSPLDQVFMFSRGATALSTASAGTSSGTNPMKTYVDGVELADPQYLNQIDPKSIERIEIVTGPQASTIYGSNAINGVMQVFTKRGSGAQRPQFTATLLSGWVENNFRPTRTPQHDDAVQVNGVEGHWAYNAGGSWTYMGPWTPGKQTARLSDFGGARIQRGPVTVDGSLRLATTRTRRGGDSQQAIAAWRESGLYSPNYANGLASPTTLTLVGQTLGLTLGFAPVSWWSHELVLGGDRSASESRGTVPAFTRPSDTALALTQSTVDRRSLRYASTVQVPLAQMARALVTVGADAWQSLSTSLNLSALALTGTLTPSGTPTITRQPGHNAGGFLQAQVGLWEQLFVTYGLRGEWNPAYGDEAQPNWAPRYGMSYTRDLGTPFGPLTAKLRASYGRSTRPPSVGAKAAQSQNELSGASFANTNIIPYYGYFDWVKANPELGPEHQRGGEGGLELYLGNRGSLVVTRYNQTVGDLIAAPVVDSARTLAPTNGATVTKDNCDGDGYCYIRQLQSLNVGSIRNQGWELQGTMVMGPMTTRGTYSWTKSRVIGIDPRYRAVLTLSKYQPGASFGYLPEHTWAGSVTYAQAGSMVTLNLSGTGMLTNGQNVQYSTKIASAIRLVADRARLNLGSYAYLNAGYVLADLNASRRFSSRVEGLLQVLNLGDMYRNDSYAGYATLGRQTKFGLRLRL